MRFGSDGLRDWFPGLVAAEEDAATDYESTITILCARRDADGFKQLQHHDRSGHVEATRESFWPADDRRELAEPGSLYLPGGVFNRVVPHIQRSRRIPHSDWSLSSHPQGRRSSLQSLW